ERRGCRHGALRRSGRQAGAFLRERAEARERTPQTHVMLPDQRLQDSLKEIARRYRDDSYAQRSAAYWNVSKQRAYMKGLRADWRGSPWTWWGFDDHPDQAIRGAAPRSNKHINIYQSTWRKLQGAIQTAGIPGTVFLPQRASSEED